MFHFLNFFHSLPFDNPRISIIKLKLRWSYPPLTQFTYYTLCTIDFMGWTPKQMFPTELLCQSKLFQSRYFLCNFFVSESLANYSKPSLLAIAIRYFQDSCTLTTNFLLIFYSKTSNFNASYSKAWAAPYKIFLDKKFLTLLVATVEENYFTAGRESKQIGNTSKFTLFAENLPNHYFFFTFLRKQSIFVQKLITAHYENIGDDVSNDD